MARENDTLSDFIQGSLSRSPDMVLTPTEDPEEKEKDKPIQVLDSQDIKLLTTFVINHPDLFCCDFHLYPNLLHWSESPQQTL